MAKPAPRLNVLDRAITAISPAWGKARLRDRIAIELGGGYFGGSARGRPALSGWNPGAADADGDISPDLVDLRAYSRDLARSSALAGGAISSVVTNVVGTGLACQPTPDAEFLGLSEDEARQWIADTNREYKLWAESTDCDLTRTQNIYGLQALAFRSVLESGDVFPLLTAAGAGRPYKLALQLIEADRVSNPNFGSDSATMTAGIEIDANGAPFRCHISSAHPGSRYRTGMTWQAVDVFGAQSGRRNVLHLFDRRRPGQSRGVPYLAAVIEPLKQLKRYSEAEISAAVISAAFAVFVKMDSEAFDSLFEGDDAKKYLAGATKWDGTVPQANLDNPGKAVQLLPGESVEAPALGRPNAQFDPFVNAVLRQVGVGLELPVEVLTKAFNSSYSAARAALLDAWRFYRGRRDWLATVFCQPVYEAWLEEAVAIGRIRAPGFFADPAYRRAWSGALWTGDGPGSIDPNKEISAAIDRIDAGVSTLAAESLLYDGVDWETKNRQRAREVAARRAAGVDNVAALGSSGSAATDPGGPQNPNDAPPAPVRKPPRVLWDASGAADVSLDRRGIHDAEPGIETHLDVAIDKAASPSLELQTALVGISAAMTALAAREPAAPHVEIHAGDTHVAAPEIHNHVAAAPAPVVQQAIHVQPAAAPVVENHVDVHVPEAAATPADAVRKIEIVSMPGIAVEALPARQTTSEVERDAAGDIVSTKQTERDA